MQPVYRHHSHNPTIALLTSIHKHDMLDAFRMEAHEWPGTHKRKQAPGSRLCLSQSTRTN
ncbi:hypothetical protein NITHO_2510004 [Nitrolancea hollandica Lb]|uniref:Uncharacterized protein n=1 Tax=Nitrolancea hollandica Lb TaxID=1129897 RepID=I4EFZ4_9BACT|nr:hypothetical protein NITHO_2510004 [Nitrolancea hollandica Lb]